MDTQNLPCRTGTWLILLLLLSWSTAAVAQTTVEGTVIDAEAESPLPGVNVRVQDTQIGTLTNSEGRFTIELPEDQRTLVFSFVGFSTQEVTVPDGETEIQVSMELDVVGIDEVVVTGLASSVKRENLANAVTKIDEEDIAGTVEPSTLDGALQGKLAGVKITSQSGAPGGGINCPDAGHQHAGSWLLTAALHHRRCLREQFSDFNGSVVGRRSRRRQPRQRSQSAGRLKSR